MFKKIIENLYIRIKNLMQRFRLGDCPFCEIPMQPIDPPASIVQTVKCPKCGHIQVLSDYHNV